VVASSNGSMILDSSSLLWGLVVTAPVSCAPIVATDEMRPSLLGHYSSDGTEVVDCLSFATEGYGL
jgi:hypothetical protein